MSRWSAHLLAPSYPKRVVGFDFRELPIPNIQTLGIPVPAPRERTERAATLDPELWRRLSVVEFDDERNGLNLIDVSADSIYEGRAPAGSIVVAFDLPESLASNLSSTFGLRPLESARIFASAHWRLVGFDIVDARTQSSALYSFDLTEAEQNRLRCGLPFPLNAYGLLDLETKAIPLCVEFDDVIPGHAPFAPCGVWITG